MTPNASPHAPVLLEPVLEALRPRPGGITLDATVGFAGHAEEILRRSAPDGRFFGLDRDERALGFAGERLEAFGARAVLRQGDFARFEEVFPEIGEGSLDGVLADLGVSSLQFDDPARGFSLQRDGPLDMRMDLSQKETADTYLRHVSLEELEERLREAGEERFARRLAGLLKRPEGWVSTGDLAAAVARSVPRRGRTHPATRVFLALRMAVNREPESLREFLRKVPARLKPGGRLAVISFHSAEDRIVKRFYKETVWGDSMRAVTKSPLTPERAEQLRNPRSRSAKLRVFEKEG